MRNRLISEGAKFSINPQTRVLTNNSFPLPIAPYIMVFPHSDTLWITMFCCWLNGSSYSPITTSGLSLLNGPYLLINELTVINSGISSIHSFLTDILSSSAISER